MIWKTAPEGTFVHFHGAKREAKKDGAVERPDWAGLFAVTELDQGSHDSGMCSKFSGRMSIS